MGGIILVILIAIVWRRLNREIEKWRRFYSVSFNSLWHFLLILSHFQLVWRWFEAVQFYCFDRHRIQWNWLDKLFEKKSVQIDWCDADHNSIYCHPALMDWFSRIQLVILLSNSQVWFKNRRAKWRKQRREEQEQIRRHQTPPGGGGAKGSAVDVDDIDDEDLSS